MFDSIAQDIRQQFNFGNAVTQLIIINLAVFLLIIITFVFIAIFGGDSYQLIQNNVMSYLSVHSDLMTNVKRPWVLFTHMFLHRGLWHFVWNMLLLWWFGRIFGDLMGDRRVVPLYIMCGLVGVVFYMLGVNFVIPSAGFAYGASAAVLGIVIATAAVAPDYSIHMILIGPVRLKYIALTIIVLDLIGIAAMDNTGGHFGHFGGMAMGWYFIYLVKRGFDPTDWFHNTYDSFIGLFQAKEKKSRNSLKVSHRSKVFSQGSTKRQNQEPKQGPSSDFQERLDAILEKISKNGIQSLSEDEREFLDKASNKRD